MAFCSHCGTQVTDGANVCPSCRSPIFRQPPASSTSPTDHYCSACGGVVARHAPSCPHCGKPWPAGQPLFNTSPGANCQSCIGVLFLVVLGGLLVMMGMCG